MPRNGYNFAQVFETFKADYAAAKPSKYRRTRTALYGNADAHYASDWEFTMVREYARDMDRNDAIIGQLLDRAVDNVVRNGFVLEPQTGDVGLNKELRARFDDWAGDRNQCDIAGEHTFGQQERLAYRHLMVDGDIFALRLDAEGAIQLVEAHRSRTPVTTRNVVHGVLLDPATRRREQYWFLKDDVNPFVRNLRVGQMDQIDARDEDGELQVYHLYKPSRYSQTRGITWFKSILDVAGNFDDLNFAKLIQAQMVSMIGLAIENAGGQQMGPREQGQPAASDGSIKTFESLSPGFIYRGKNGEKITSLSSNVPNAEFFPHAKLLLSFISLQFGIPLWVAVLDASEANFSSQRSVFQQAKIGFVCNQELLKTQFHTPIYRWKLRQWLAQASAKGGLGEVARGLAAKAGRSLFGHKWNTPAWQYQQPEVEAQADKLRKDNLLASPRQIHAEQGRDFVDVYTEAVEDNGAAIEMAIKKAVEIETRTGMKVTWQDILFGGNAGLRMGMGGGGGGAGGGTEVDAQKDFERKVWLGFQKDGTVSDIMANAVKLKELTVRVGLPPEEDYDEPWLPVQADNPAQRPLVTGEVIKDKQGDIVGGDLATVAPTPAPASAGGGSGGAAKPSPAPAKPAASPAKQDQFTGEISRIYAVLSEHDKAIRALPKVIAEGNVKLVAALEHGLLAGNEEAARQNQAMFAQWKRDHDELLARLGSFDDKLSNLDDNYRTLEAKQSRDRTTFSRDVVALQQSMALIEGQLKPLIDTAAAGDQGQGKNGDEQQDPKNKK